LEGSDQHRGWFQSSLWTSVIARDGKPPYRAVLTHGFIVDEERKKISKSSTYEKPQTSDAYIAEYGADVIRLWIASQDFRDDIPISKEILSHIGETYRLFRNTFRFQIANLFDFDPARDAVPVAELDTLDRWALHQTAGLIGACTEAYESYEFHRVYQLCNPFFAVTLSATYHDILKDRLYTLGTNSRLRRSSQTALYHIFRALARLLAPIIAFTADEAWAFGIAKSEFTEDSVHLQDWPAAPDDWNDPQVEKDMSALLQVRSRVNAEIEPLRAAGKLGKGLDAWIGLAVPENDPLLQILKNHRDFLAELFIVSHVTIESVQAQSRESSPSAAAPDAGSVHIEVRHSQDLGNVRCPRCWRWVPQLESTPRGDLCPRCTEALR
jgi:isoleucyl-tRNA synthetase